MQSNRVILRCLTEMNSMNHEPGVLQQLEGRSRSARGSRAGISGRE
jgi:hypothetical protein